MQVRIIVHGQVQGVFFRHTTKRVAEKLGVTGWVKNVDDNKVEIVAEGEEDKLKELITWCHQGPPMAQVNKVDVKWLESFEGFDGFSIR